LSLSESAIDASLVVLYRETHYEVAGEERFTLRIGEASAPLADAHRRHGVDCSAFITACNPFSELLGVDENARRHAELARELVRRGLAHVAGVGQHPSNVCPGEASYLVFGLTLQDAKTLACLLDQNAIVWCGADGVPRLVMLR
jgi:hypothetical protein